MAEDTVQETVHMLVPSVVAASGAALHPGRDYFMPKKMANIRYQRGHAKPAAEVYMERLKAMGVVGLTVDADAEVSVKAAAKKLGLQVSSGK